MTDSKDSAAAAFAEANGFELKIVSKPDPVNPDKSEKPASGSDLNHGNGELISEAADKFGSQCVVVAIDAKRREDGGWNIFKNRIELSVAICNA